MYNQFKTVISGGCDIPTTAKRIGVYHLHGRLTDEQAEDLYDLLNKHADPESNRPEVTVTLKALSDRLYACENALSELEKMIKQLSNSTDTPESDENESVFEYPVWTPWDGISQNYSYGDIVQHNGELWISEYTAQNTWEPGVIGTERLWIRYTPPADAEQEEAWQ